MAGITKKQWAAGRTKSQRGTEESPFAKWTLIAHRDAVLSRVSVAAVGQRFRAGVCQGLGGLLVGADASGFVVGDQTHPAGRGHQRAA